MYVDMDAFLSDWRFESQSVFCTKKRMDTSSSRFLRFFLVAHTFDDWRLEVTAMEEQGADGVVLHLCFKGVSMPSLETAVG